MIKTMAVEITENTYPIAVACLPPAFALIKKRLVLGCYLVINDLQFSDYQPEVEVVDEDEPERYTPRRPRNNYHRYGSSFNRKLTLVNYWEPKKSFKKTFKIVNDSSTPDEFFEIVKK